MNKLKKFAFPLVVVGLLTPATAFAINPLYVDKSQSIGEIFRYFVFNPLAWMMLPVILAYMLLPAMILGWFVHRKYIVQSLCIMYSALFLLSIILTDKLSDTLLGDIVMYLAFVLFISVSFFAATIMNNFKKKKQNFSNKDYIPLAIIAAITLILIFLPIRSGDLVCKTPIVNKNFNCDNYLQEAERLNRSWFVL